MMFFLLSKKTLKLYEKYAEKYPGVNYEHFMALADLGWCGLDLSEKEIIDVLEKCIKEDKICLQCLSFRYHRPHQSKLCEQV